MVGLIASDAEEKYTGKFETSAVNCRINLDRPEIEKEEKNYRELPVYYDFGDHKELTLLQNFFRINREVEAIVRQFSQPATAPPQQKVTL